MEDANKTYNRKYFEEYLDELKEMYDEDRIIEGIDFVKDLESKVLAGDLTSRDNLSEEFNDYEKFKSHELISRVYDDNQLFYRCWDSYKYLQTQKPERSSNGIDVWFKYEEDVKAITICAKVILKASFMKILACLSEIDLMKVDKFDSIELIKKYSLFRWLVRVKLKMPMGVADREVVAVGFGTPIPQSRSLIMPFRTVKDSYYNIQIPPEDSNYKRIDVNYGFYHIKYIDDDYCEFTNCFNVDPKVPLIPWFLLNGFTKELGYYVMDDLRKMVENQEMDEVYNERIKTKQIFYDKIWNVVTRLLEN